VVEGQHVHVTSCGQEIVGVVKWRDMRTLRYAASGLDDYFLPLIGDGRSGADVSQSMIIGLGRR
jgi:hypothetical protein